MSCDRRGAARSIAAAADRATLISYNALMTEGARVKPGRNDSCPCGSGRKFKACCGRLEAVQSPSASLRQLAALMDSGRDAELEVSALALLRSHPDEGLAWQLLGVALTRQGKDALEALAAAAVRLPRDAVVQLNFGNALGRAGRLSEAEDSYRLALLARPGFAEAHNNLADVELELGRPMEAADNARRALELRPDYAEAHHSLGRALLGTQRPEEAIASCARAIALQPGEAATYNTRGAAQLMLARFEPAKVDFFIALRLRPGFAEAHANLGNAFRSTGNLDEAVASYQRALELSPEAAAVHVELGTALRLKLDAMGAERSCRRALELDPAATGALAVLAELRADAGRFAEAEQLYKEAISIDAGSAEAWAGIVRTRRMTKSDGSWLANAQRLADNGLAPQRELLVRYAIGKYYDDVGEFANAFESYRCANELARRWGPGHDRGALERAVEVVIRSFPRAGASTDTAAGPAARPVFIVGMLRSGTSLAEQILASHPSVFGAGELTFWSTRLGEGLADAVHANAATLEIDAGELASLRRGYLEMLAQQAPGAARITDKLPTNFLAIGLIHAALPDARIIHLERDPLDTCLSIYFQHLEAANTYANDLGDLAHYYGQYRRVMRHWRATVPRTTLLHVPYEGLVTDPERWARAMLDFIGLAWDPRCLEFNRTDRAVVTASKWQVRQGISTGSIARWRRYERFVAPLFPLLSHEDHVGSPI